jgi:hypothetical protein
MEPWNFGTMKPWNPEPGTRQPTIGNSNPRDWIIRTCSVSPRIKRDRHKYRLKQGEDLPEIGGMGEVCLEVKLRAKSLGLRA